MAGRKAVPPLTPRGPVHRDGDTSAVLAVNGDAGLSRPVPPGAGKDEGCSGMRWGPSHSRPPPRAGDRRLMTSNWRERRAALLEGPGCYELLRAHQPPCAFSPRRGHGTGHGSAGPGGHTHPPAPALVSPGCGTAALAQEPAPGPCPLPGPCKPPGKHPRDRRPRSSLRGGCHSCPCPLQSRRAPGRAAVRAETPVLPRIEEIRAAGFIFPVFFAQAAGPGPARRQRHR